MTCLGEGEGGFIQLAMPFTNGWMKEFHCCIKKCLQIPSLLNLSEPERRRELYMDSTQCSFGRGPLDCNRRI